MRAGDDWWATTVKGNALANASFGKPISRATATRLLGQVIERARAYNADPARLLTVTEIVVFGSYLDPAVDLLGDLDLAVSTARRDTDGQRYVDKVLEYARASGRSFSAFHDRLFWPARELRMILKNRSPAISITDEDIRKLTERIEIVYVVADDPEAIPPPRTRWPVPDQPGVGASLAAARLPPPEPSPHPASDRRLPVGPQIREQSQASRSPPASRRGGRRQRRPATRHRPGPRPLRALTARPPPTPPGPPQSGTPHASRPPGRLPSAQTPIRPAMRLLPSADAAREQTRDAAEAARAAERDRDRLAEDLSRPVLGAGPHHLRHLRHRLHLTSEARPGRFPFQIQPSATHPKVLKADRRPGPRQSRCGRYPDGRPTAAGDDPGHGVRCLSPRLCAPNGDGHDRLGGPAVGDRLG